MNRAFDLGTYAFLVAGIFVLTSPKSKGPQLVKALGGSFSGVVQAASGQRVTAGK